MSTNDSKWRSAGLHRTLLSQALEFPSISLLQTKEVGTTILGVRMLTLNNITVNISSIQIPFQVFLSILGGWE